MHAVEYRPACNSSSAALVHGDVLRTHVDMLGLVGFNGSLDLMIDSMLSISKITKVRVQYGLDWSVGLEIDSLMSSS